MKTKRQIKNVPIKRRTKLLMMNISNFLIRSIVVIEQSECKISIKKGERLYVLIIFMN